MPSTDFDGDGLDDILWRDRDTGVLGTWLASDTGGFADNSANSLIGVPSQWFVAATGDFNGDGRDDLAWLNLSSESFGTWSGRADGGFTINQPMLSFFSDFSIVGAGDFNADGRDELVIIGVRETTNILDIMLPNPDGQFDYSDGAFGEVAKGWSVAGVGDFNGDGRADILWRHANGTIGDWLSSAGFNFFGQGLVVNNASLVQVSNDWQIIGVGDFNGDGRADILWRNDNGWVGNWVGTANGVFQNNDTHSLTFAPLDWQVAGIGDYNGDGFDDLLWRNSSTGAFGTWYGAPGGAFTIDDNLQIVPLNWIIQPNPAGVGVWDY